MAFEICIVIIFTTKVTIFHENWSFWFVIANKDLLVVLAYLGKFTSFYLTEC
jgi:hypothetical protein